MKGNHDAALVGEEKLEHYSDAAKGGILRHKKICTDESDLAWLKSRPYQHQDENLRCVAVHGSFCESQMFYYHEDLRRCHYDITKLSEELPWARILFSGHTHNAFILDFKKDTPMLDVRFHQYEKPEASVGIDTLKMQDDRIYLVNCGSVGYPRRLAKSVYVIYDSEEQTLSFRSLPFDFEVYREILFSKGISAPLWLSCRLEGLKM